MNPIKTCVAVLVAVSTLAIHGYSRAGIYADELGKCLVEATSQRDRLDLVRWIFSAASMHPAVAPISSLSDEQLDEANKVVAALIMELLTNSCRSETEKALQYEGTATIETAFSVLGQVAGQELFASQEVSSALSGLESYLDEEKLESLMDTE